MVSILLQKCFLKKKKNIGRWVPRLLTVKSFLVTMLPSDLLPFSFFGKNVKSSTSRKKDEIETCVVFDRFRQEIEKNRPHLPKTKVLVHKYSAQYAVSMAKIV